MKSHWIGLLVLPVVLLMEQSDVSAAILTVGTNINITKLINNQTETTIVVNPSNPQNLFAAANGGFNSGSGHAGLPSVFY